MRLQLRLSDTPSLAQAWTQRVQVHTVAQVRTSLLGHLLLAVDEGLGWSVEGTEVVVLCEWGDWLHNNHALLVIAHAHASSSPPPPQTPPSPPRHRRRPLARCLLGSLQQRRQVEAKKQNRKQHLKWQVVVVVVGV